ncbi:MAG: L-serine ammonia-lyase, iron-sulfur-dependent, subunit alpha [Peptococcaceae bacterium]|nr:L-serine ammonia-lyase, iron-sulfur-dependent, subunit alpha [Peptococcaceae bacterium]
MMYNSFKELLTQTEERKLTLWQVILENEEQLGGLSEGEIFQRLESRYQVMEASAQKALKKPLSTVGHLIEGVASTQSLHASSGNTICGPFINEVMAMALSCSEVNASMGKICAAPTAGACGVLPAVLLGLSGRKGLSRRETLQGLATASGVGAIITKNATVAGAEGGCQAECGVAAAMAAAAAAEMQGGSPAMAINAVALALMNVMGLVCDPVAGLVQVPCAQRNASQAVNALISADMALGGMKSIIPCDQVVEAMARVGRMLPMELRETALGGVAATPAGKEYMKEIFGR